MIIVLFGIAGSGKNTAADYIKLKYNNVRLISVADQIKKFFSVFFDVPFENINGISNHSRMWREVKSINILDKVHSPRNILCKIGDTLTSIYGKDFLIEQTLKGINLSGNNIYVFTDIRYKSQLDYLIKYYKDKLIIINIISDKLPFWYRYAESYNINGTYSPILDTIHQSEYDLVEYQSSDITIHKVTNLYGKIHKMNEQIDAILNSYSKL